MEDKCEDEAKVYFDKLVKSSIRSFMEWHAPGISKKYPDFPRSLPNTIIKSEICSEPPKSLKEDSKKKRQSKGKTVVKAEAVIKEEPTRRESRRNRYSGTYNEDKNDNIYENTFEDLYIVYNKPTVKKEKIIQPNCLQSLQLQHTVSNLSSNSLCDSSKTSLTSQSSEKKKREINIPSTKPRKRIRTFSETSSDEEDPPVKSLIPSIIKTLDEDIKKDAMNDVQINVPQKKTKLLLSETSSDEDDDVKDLKKEQKDMKTLDVPKNDDGTKEKMKQNEIPKAANCERPSPNSNEVVLEKKVQKTPVLKLLKPATSKSYNSQLLKSSFQNSASFDDAMKMYNKKKQEMEKLIPPKIIPPPESDPTIKKTKKIPAKKLEKPKVDENPKNLERLGGIFTINNGWDKNVEAKSNAQIKRTITPPKIVIDSSIDDDVLDAHNEFMFNGNILDNNMIAHPNSPSFSDSSTSLDLKIDFDEDSNDAKNEVEVPPKKIQSSINSSEDYDSYEEDEVIKSPKKAEKFSYFDNTNKPASNLETVERDHDVISLCGDFGDLDDLEDEVTKTQPSKEIKSKKCGRLTHIDDLTIISENVEHQVQPLDPEAEFDLNTMEISNHMVDPETDKIIKTYFGNVCPAFLENRCSMPKCGKNHFLIAEERFRPLVIHAPFDVLQSIYMIVLRFHRLFRTYIAVFVEISIKNKDEMGLIELVKGCDRHPRTISCYKDIVRKMISMDYMKEHRAISFIITHHTDSEIARDTILSLILDSGPCVSFFMDYIEQLHMKSPIRIDMFNKILHTCVAYQNPKLPNFCLNYIQAIPLQQMASFNTSHLKTFIEMNRYMSEVNEARESKLIAVFQKMMMNNGDHRQF